MAKNEKENPLLRELLEKSGFGSMEEALASAIKKMKERSENATDTEEGKNED